MRLLIILLFFVICAEIRAEEYTVFEKNGLYGIKDQGGIIIVPAVYERLGWSDGTSEVRDGVIGFSDGKLWGLINVKNKALTDQTYHSILPIGNGRFKASVKGKFSNQLFYGLLDKQGKVMVSFDYFSLDILGDHILVSQYENQERFGLISWSRDIIIPIEYQTISVIGSLYLAYRKNHDLDIYLSTGEQVEKSLDSIEKTTMGYVCRRDGYVGFINKDGTLNKPFQYQKINVMEEVIHAVPFPTWSVYKEGELLFDIEADSISLNNQGFWLAYRNGFHHFALKDSIFTSNDFELKEITETNYVLKDTKTSKWSVIDRSGQEFLNDYDSIFSYPYGFWCLKGDVWTLHNRYGNRKTDLEYDGLKAGVMGQFVVKKNDYWGVINPIGGEVTPYKFDSLVRDTLVYKVKFFEKWGIMNPDGRWLVNPEYQEIYVFKHLMVGRRGLGFTYIDQTGQSTKTTYRPIRQLDDLVLLRNLEGHYGLIDSNLNVVVYPEYDSIIHWGGFFEMRDSSYVSLINKQGESILKPKDKIEKILSYSEDYFLVKKNNKFGFLDNQGRLRISNRYDNAQPFHEGLAAVMLKGKWAFINKEEVIVIQPFYETGEPFKNGLSVVSKQSKYGLINRKGEEIVALSWKKIKRLKSENYLVMDERNKVGVISKKGDIILRPAFDAIEDKGDRLIVTFDGKVGVLDYKGNQLFKTQYEEIKIFDGYTIVKY